MKHKTRQTSSLRIHTGLIASLLCTAVILTASCHSNIKSSKVSSDSSSAQTSGVALSSDSVSDSGNPVSSSSSSSSAISPSSITSSSNSPKTNPNSILDNMIFLDGHFLGSCKDGKWNSVDENKSMGISKVKFTLDDINATFKASGFSKYSVTGKTGKVSSLSREYDTSEDGSFASWCCNDDHLNTILWLSGDINPLPRSVTVISGNLSRSDFVNPVKSILAGYGITQSSINITGALSADIDNDGKVETIVNANTIVNSDTNPEGVELNPGGKTGASIPTGYGVYSMVIELKDGKAVPVYKKILSAGNYDYIEVFFRSSLLGVFDLNKDGKMEICVEQTGWEWAENMVYTYDGNKYVPVLYSWFQ